MVETAGLALRARGRRWAVEGSARPGTGRLCRRTAQAARAALIVKSCECLLIEIAGLLQTMFLLEFRDRLLRLGAHSPVSGALVKAGLY